MDQQMNASQCKLTLQVEIITMGLFYRTLMCSLPYVGPAYELALTDIHTSFPCLNVSQSIIYNKNPIYQECEDYGYETDRELADFYYHRFQRWKSADVVVILQTCADCYSDTALNFASNVNSLLILAEDGTKPRSTQLSYSNLIATGVLSEPIVQKLYLNLIQFFGWKQVAIVCDTTSNDYFIKLCTVVQKQLTENEGQIVVHRFDFNPANVDFKQLLTNIRELTSVILHFGHSTPLRRLMLEAQHLNLTSGKHVFITHTPYRYSSLGNFTSRFGDAMDMDARTAFRSLFILETQTRKTSELSKIYDYLRRSTAERYNYTYKAEDTVSPHAISAYASMKMLAQVLNDSLQAGRTSDVLKIVRNTSLLSSQFHDRTFHLSTGELHLNADGERVPNFVLNRFNADGNLTTVMRVNTELVRLELVQQVDWFAGHPWPISSRPGCDGLPDRCADSSQLVKKLIPGTAAAVLLVLLLLTGILVKCWMVNSDKETWWLLDRSVFTPLMKKSISVSNSRS